MPLPLALTLLLSPAAQALTPNQARELLQDYYIDEVPEDVLDQNTIQAMLEALGDPYTTYFSPEEYGAFTGSMSDTDTVGVGIYSLVTADGPLIQRVYENTPAADAGLQPGDLVTAVDGRSTAGQDAGTVAAWLKGDPGTRVELSYRRDGAEYTAVLTRRAITVPATYTELWDGHIGYIDCDTFGGETVAHFVSGMEDTAAGADHWIVDLRGNGGGEVDAAMGAAGCFTGSGVLAYLKDSTGAYGAYGSNDDARTLSPVIVLTDGETASASELFASDIRDTNTGILVGGRTFGKGVAQTVLDQRALPDYFPDGDAIKITSYRFYAPSGSTTDTVGLIPHLLVDPDLAPEVATLLSASSPKGSTEGYLRIDFNWRWYVELDTALSETHRDAFTALLEALPDGVRVLEGTGGPDGWADTTVEELVGRYVLTSYRDRSFTDTAGSPYAAQIDRLATYGILAGTGGGAFQPEGSLTRAQLCALLAQALNCRVPTGESQFTDVSMDDWYGLCVNAVARLGLVEGVGEGRFAPDAPVSHEQFITIMARLSQRLNMYMDLTLQEMPADAAEAAGLLSYSGWARDSVWLLALSQKGLLGNTINLLWEPVEDIDPAAVTTREEAAAPDLYPAELFRDSSFKQRPPSTDGGHSVCFYRSGQQQLVVGLSELLRPIPPAQAGRGPGFARAGGSTTEFVGLRQGFASGSGFLPARRRRRPICDGEASGYDSSSLSSASSELISEPFCLRPRRRRRPRLRPGAPIIDYPARAEVNFACGKVLPPATLARRRRRPICDGEASGYDSSSLSSASSELALLNSARSCSTVSFFFSSPAISTTIRPS